MAEQGDFIEESIAELEKESAPRVFDEKMLTEPLSVLSPSEPVVVETQTSALEAIGLMQEHSLGCVVVVRSGKIKGIFSERDVLTRIVGRGVDAAKMPVRKVMTANPETLRVTDSIAYGLNLMSIGGYRHIPLVDAAGTPVGVISVKDIIGYLVDFFPKSILNLPTMPRGNYAREREGA